MVEQTVDDEPRVQTVVNAAGTKPRIVAGRIRPGPQQDGSRGDDADDPFNGDADGPGGA